VGTARITEELFDVEVEGLTGAAEKLESLYTGDAAAIK
jgi:hypothetical protein